MHLALKIMRVTSVCLLVAASAQAAFPTWNGSVSDNWTNNANWNGDAPGVGDTAQVWSSTPRATVIYSGDHVTPDQVWVSQGHSAVDGNLTIQAGASLTTTIEIETGTNGVLTSNGEINCGRFFRGRDNGVISINDDPGVAVDLDSVNSIQMSETSIFNLGICATASAPDATFLNSSTGLFASTSTFVGDLRAQASANVSVGGSVTGTVTVQNSATGAIGGAVTGDLWVRDTANVLISGSVTGTTRVWEDASLVLGGTLNGELDIGSSNALNRITATGTVIGNCKLGTGDRLVVAGTVTNGLFSLNNGAVAVIESTAQIFSSGNDTWLYDSGTAVTWLVGADGSVGTWRTDRNESSPGAWDGEVRYNNTPTAVCDLTAYDSVTYGATLTVKLATGIQSAATFAANTTFLINEVEHTDVTHLGGADFQINNIPLDLPAGTVIAIR